jgi:hypothetical protein
MKSKQFLQPVLIFKALCKIWPDLSLKMILQFTFQLRHPVENSSAKAPDFCMQQEI